VAGFLNTDGGTMLIGIGPDRSVVGLGYDYQRVKAQNGDGVRQLAHASSHARPRPRGRHANAGADHPARRPRDLAARRRPILPPRGAKTSTKAKVFYVRMNNSTRDLPDDELDQDITDRRPPSTVP
jgi:type I restriction enzyme R subunit